MVSNRIARLPTRLVARAFRCDRVRVPCRNHGGTPPAAVFFMPTFCRGNIAVQYEARVCPVFVITCVSVPLQAALSIRMRTSGVCAGANHEHREQ